MNSAESERLLEAHGYLWDNRAYGYRRVRRVRDPQPETTEEYAAHPNIISFEELEDRGCFKQDATVGERHASEDWLRKRLIAAD